MSHKPFALQKPGYRVERITQRVKEELSLLVPELVDPRLEDIGLITITDVQMAKDLRNAIVLFSVLDEKAKPREIEDALNESSNYLRKQVMLSLASKVTPQLHFKFDKGYVGSRHMDALFKQVEEDRKQRGPVQEEDTQNTTPSKDDDETQDE